MLNHDTKVLLKRNADVAVKKVAAQCGGEHVDKGAFCRLFTLPTKDAGMENLVEIAHGWAGGRSNIDKIAKYQVLSYEKALRLALNARVHGHIASEQSAWPQRHQYQGAAMIRAVLPKIGSMFLITSVSGLPAPGDERAGLYTIELMNWGAGHSIVNALVLTDNYEAYKMLGK